ncbi:hypothetical protein NE686_18115 [Tissierella carlieri]|uniref:Uncharacterized protein n=1 Tax=Tissierella carlieri TaxID=689904 RepID=A0ABT1SGH5_9FIRM|nr:hypothetical protein [Tissierella carlieri]MCQ4925022.1 hypothetical protein [Tissierella carlieri]
MHNLYKMIRKRGMNQGTKVIFIDPENEYKKLLDEIVNSEGEKREWKIKLKEKN